MDIIQPSNKTKRQDDKKKPWMDLSEEELDRAIDRLLASLEDSAARIDGIIGLV